MSGGVLVAGAGLAGARCAEALRAGGYDGPITLAGAEPLAPYERPALSKELLASERDAHEILLRPPGWWAEQGIDLRLGTRVEHLDPGRRTALLGGRVVAWEHLVVATGAHARALPGLPPSTHALRTARDALSLRGRLGPGTRLTIVGAGLIGAEVASTAVGRGCEVTLVEAAPVPLRSVLGAEVGLLLAARWESHGVRVRAGVPVARVESSSLELADGAAIPHDVLLVAVGVEAAGVAPDLTGPVATDACGRTAIPRVYACGDAAAFDGAPGGHWTAAAGQAKAVARAILGEPEPYRDLPYFWSDQFGVRLQVVGDPRDAERVELDGDDDSFAARYLDAAGSPVAVALANRAGDVAAARRELAAAA